MIISSIHPFFHPPIHPSIQFIHPSIYSIIALPSTQNCSTQWKENQISLGITHLILKWCFASCVLLENILTPLNFNILKWTIRLIIPSFRLVEHKCMKDNRFFSPPRIRYEYSQTQVCLGLYSAPSGLAYEVVLSRIGALQTIELEKALDLNLSNFLI